MTDLAQERMDAAAESIRESAGALQAGQQEKAGTKAAEAAEHLERLARQVAHLQAEEPTAQLGRTQDLARTLARQQQALAAEIKDKSASPGTQRAQTSAQKGLGEEARTLADLFGHLQETTGQTDAPLGRALRQVSETSPPQAIVDQMRRASDALQAGRRHQARRDGDTAARQLDTLAQQLDAARHALTQPQLDQLLATEKKAAEVQKALNSVTSEVYRRPRLRRSLPTCAKRWIPSGAKTNDWPRPGPPWQTHSRARPGTGALPTPGRMPFCRLMFRPRNTRTACSASSSAAGQDPGGDPQGCLARSG